MPAGTPSVVLVCNADFGSGSAQVLPILVGRLSAPIPILFEALWTITNIASGTSQQTAQVTPALPKIAELIRSRNDEVSEQAVWCIGNIAGDSATCRDLVLQAGALESLVAILGRLSVKATEKIGLLRNAVWSISNCVRAKPPPDLNLVRPALPALAKALWETDAEVVADACWALSYVSDGTNDRVQAVIDAGVLTQIVRPDSPSSWCKMVNSSLWFDTLHSLMWTFDLVPLRSCTLCRCACWSMSCIPSSRQLCGWLAIS